MYDCLGWMFFYIPSDVSYLKDDGSLFVTATEYNTVCREIPF